MWPPPELHCGDAWDLSDEALLKLPDPQLGLGDLLVAMVERPGSRLLVTGGRLPHLEHEGHRHPLSEKPLSSAEILRLLLLPLGARERSELLSRGSLRTRVESSGWLCGLQAEADRQELTLEARRLGAVPRLTPLGAPKKTSEGWPPQVLLGPDGLWELSDSALERLASGPDFKLSDLLARVVKHGAQSLRLTGGSPPLVHLDGDDIPVGSTALSAQAALRVLLWPLTEQERRRLLEAGFLEICPTPPGRRFEVTALLGPLGFEAVLRPC